ncbi:MAG: NAD(P)H-dependent oxidoreductase [Pseudomonadota bacterium]
MTTNILRIDASARHEGSITRALSDVVIERLTAQGPVRVDTLDLAKDVPPAVDDAWIGANITAPEERTDAQKQALATSDALVARLKAADVIVIGAPIYNFSIPAPLKAWIDQIARARVTFRYTENGPVGMLEGKRAYLLIGSGGVPVDSPVDFATPYLRHALGFVGVHDVTVFAGDRTMQRPEAREAAIAEIQRSMPRATS